MLIKFNLNYMTQILLDRIVHNVIWLYPTKDFSSPKIADLFSNDK